jgi:hypothetical protein
MMVIAILLKEVEDSSLISCVAMLPLITGWKADKVFSKYWTLNCKSQNTASSYSSYLWPEALYVPHA